MAWWRMRRVRQEIGRYRNAGLKARFLTWRDWKDFARAQLALLRAQREMRTLPTGEIVRQEAAPVATDSSDRVDVARRIALAVNRAAVYGVFRPKCLVRSRALRQLLEEEGVHGAHVRVGVMLSNGRFRAHAWVEYGGQVVGDDPVHVARFNPITGVEVAGLR